mgnify:CR=1 FL=1
MKCPNCAAEVTGRFCEYCGSEMKQDAPQVINITNNYYSDAPNDRIDRNFTNVEPIPTTQHYKLLAGILGLTLGFIGAHNFYLGYKKRAIIQLLLTIFSAGTISIIWGIIEGFIILSSSTYRDANGNLLK